MWIWMLVEGLGCAVAAAPLFLAWYLLRLRKADKRFPAGFFLFGLYLCGVAGVTGLPSLLYLVFSPTVQLVPFHELRADMMQYLLNVVLFLPAGFLLPLFWERYRGLKETALGGFLLSLAIECSQLFSYRTTDLNDLFTNTLGAVLGWMLWRCFGKTLGARAGAPWQAAALVWAAVFLWDAPVSGALWEILSGRW